MSDDICGYEDDEMAYPCQNPATEGDSCWIERHGGYAPNDEGGRPTKLETMSEADAYELMDTIAEVIEEGGSMVEAARKSPVHRETIARWGDMGKDKPEGDIHREFHDRLARALGESEGMYRSIALRLAIKSEDTATVMAMLKQRHQDSWGEVNRGEQAGGVVVNLGEEEEYEVDEETLEIVDGPAEVEVE